VELVMQEEMKKMRVESSFSLSNKRQIFLQLLMLHAFWVLFLFLLGIRRKMEWTSGTYSGCLLGSCHDEDNKNLKSIGIEEDTPFELRVLLGLCILKG
jgi:hypothetical protein